MSDRESSEFEDGVKLAYNSTTKTEIADAECGMEKVIRPVLNGEVAKAIALIGIYFVPSIGLTFYQRWFLKDFSLPLMVVLVHLTCKFLAAVCIRAVLSSLNKFRGASHSKPIIRGLIWVAVASGIDIGLSNWGLKLVHISMYSMTKSTTVVFILICAILFKLERKSWSQVIIVTFISGGLCLFTYKAHEFNGLGFLLLIVGSMASGVRWTCAQILLQKNAHINNPLDMIYLVQPWMFLAVLPLALFIEGPKIVDYLVQFDEIESRVVYVRGCEILFGAILAFILEFTEFLVVTYTSSLTLSIAGIPKEIIIIVMAVKFNHDHLSMINVIGLCLCLCGIISHAIYKYNNMGKSPHEGVRGQQQGVSWEQRAPLIESEVISEDEDSDSQVIFNIINNRDKD